MLIRPFHPDDTEDVVHLWERCELTRLWNDPRKDIERKLAVQAEFFLVAEESNRIVGTVMAGYDGHRGWVNYLAVDPDIQRHGLGRKLMDHIEQILLEVGCPKINLQIRASNESVITFYKSLGFQVDEVVSMGKRLISDES